MVREQRECVRSRSRWYFTMTAVVVFMACIAWMCVPANAQALKIGVAGYGRSQTVRKAIKSLRKVGADAIAVDSAEDDLAQLDALVLPGGPDINPGFYGEDNDACESGRNSLDYIQMSVLDAFLETGKPVFGICRGMQLINVYFGGTLNQNIEGHRKGRHIVENLPGTWCFEAVGGEVETNTAHHQSLKDLGKGLSVCAYSQDGVVEAVVHETLPVYAVQWHPENKPKKLGNKMLRYWLRIAGFHRLVRGCLETGNWKASGSDTAAAGLRERKARNNP